MRSHEPQGELEYVEVLAVIGQQSGRGVEPARIGPVIRRRIGLEDLFRCVDVLAEGEASAQGSRLVEEGEKAGESASKSGDSVLTAQIGQMKSIGVVTIVVSGGKSVVVPLGAEEARIRH
jgi:hypothetical protein